MGTLRWFSIPASVGFAYVCYQQLWHVKEREERKLKSGELVQPRQWQVRLRYFLFYHTTCTFLSHLELSVVITPTLNKEICLKNDNNKNHHDEIIKYMILKKKLCTV